MDELGEPVGKMVGHGFHPHRVQIRGAEVRRTNPSEQTYTRQRLRQTVPQRLGNNLERKSVIAKSGEGSGVDNGSCRHGPLGEFTARTTFLSSYERFRDRRPGAVGGDSLFRPTGRGQLRAKQSALDRILTCRSGVAATRLRPELTILFIPMESSLTAA